MAGISRTGIFKEKLSPFLAKKLARIKDNIGEQSQDYKALALQYLKHESESILEAEANLKHWEADLRIGHEGELKGIERLYRQSAVIEPTMICAAHCRYCLRANYEVFTLSDNEITKIAIYCGSIAVKEHLSEVLITGGDPLVTPKKLKFLIESLIEKAPNIRRIRIGTRLPLQDPNRVDNNIFEIFRQQKDKVTFEIGTQINHSIELFPESVEIFKKIHSLGIKIYSQNILLRGVNDSALELVSLYEKLRELDIEAHYLFHCVPMIGMHHLRTTVKRGIDLAKELTNSGKISGRIKPMFALMTDIGKITLYDGTIIDKDINNRILLQSSYSYEERMKWNPGWILPLNAQVDENGLLRVWYLDGSE